MQGSALAFTRGLGILYISTLNLYLITGNILQLNIHWCVLPCCSSVRCTLLLRLSRCYLNSIGPLPSGSFCRICYLSHLRPSQLAKLESPLGENYSVARRLLGWRLGELYF